VTDIFFSYRSVDRERVRPVRDAFVAQGFDVFWDQEVPAGVDWDGWIRQHLTQARCAVVFWSASSVASDNVRHEASIARRHGKLIPVLLEPLAVDDFPMGLYSQQAANLAHWTGDLAHAEWRKLAREVEAKLLPAWVQHKVSELEAELVAERSRREAAERRDGALQAASPPRRRRSLISSANATRRGRTATRTPRTARNCARTSPPSSPRSRPSSASLTGQMPRSPLPMPSCSASAITRSSRRCARRSSNAGRARPIGSATRSMPRRATLRRRRRRPPRLPRRCRISWCGRLAAEHAVAREDVQRNGGMK
jgi:hypothetical protein